MTFPKKGTKQEKKGISRVLIGYFICDMLYAVSLGMSPAHHSCIKPCGIATGYFLLEREVMPH